MPPASVTAVIATCNRAQYLGEALDSVLGQTAPPAQVIVVDDGSTDGTAAVLRGYGGRIEVIEQENGGKSRALNRAMPRVRGEYLWIFDDDDIALPDNVERHRAVLDVHPELGFVYSGCSVIRVHADGRVERRGRMPVPRVSEDALFPSMLEQNFMQQQGMLVRTRCYAEVGPFDESLDRGQDYEMNLRLARRFPGRGLDRASFVYRQHEGLRGRPGTQFSPRERGRSWIESNRRLLRRLHAELDLAEYLPRSPDMGPLDRPLRRRALLQRACVMARCALWEEALADFADALGDAGTPLSDDEKGMCQRALEKYIQHHVAIDGLLDNRPLARRFTRLVTDARHADAQRIFARPLARYAWEQLVRGRPLRAGHALFLARQVGGGRPLGCIS